MLLIGFVSLFSDMGDDLKNSFLDALLMFELSFFLSTS